jgi:hypothetical protein
MAKPGKKRSRTGKSRSAPDRDKGVRTPLSDDPLTPILRRAHDFNRGQGVLTWGAGAMASVDDFRPPSRERPRLFISYRWGDIELESWLDMIVASLVTRGYRVVYDRDPRNFARPLSRDAILTRMDLCNYVIAIISERFTQRVGSQDLKDAGAATHEWEHALARARQGALQLGAIWFSGDEIPSPFEAATVMDLRPLETPNQWDVLDRYFPNLTKLQAVFDPPVVQPSSLQLPGMLNRTGSLIADRNRLVTICAWKPDGSCDRLGPFLIRQLERMTASLAASSRYTHFTSEPAGAASDD